MSAKENSQKALVKEFFTNNPKRNIEHPEAVDWLTEEYKRRTGKVFRDPDRSIRYLAQEGFLIKVRKGVYRYEPEQAQSRELSYFSEELKSKIKQRDGYKCVICGRGEKDGLEIHVDHIKPVNRGGQAILENGQTLCAEHNYRKKSYTQTEMAKNLFVRLHDQALSIDDSQIVGFCTDILKVYEKHDINGHIKWSRSKKPPRRGR